MSLLLEHALVLAAVTVALVYLLALGWKAARRALSSSGGRHGCGGCSCADRHGAGSEGPKRGS
jgi:hypothetical protein